MAIPLKWSTLKQAALWLSEKTKEEWTDKKIIDFAIEQCPLDDVVEDIKFPSYLRTIIPDSLRQPITFVSLRCQDDSTTPVFVYDEIPLDEKNILTTFLFKDNLVELKAKKGSAIQYVESSHSQLNNKLIPALAENNQKPVMIYCELHPFIINLDKGWPEFPVLPPIKIDYGTIGIRDEELKQLLRNYLVLSKQAPNKVKELTEKEIEGLNRLTRSCRGCSLHDEIAELDESDHVTTPIEEPASKNKALIDSGYSIECNEDLFTKDDMSLFDSLNKAQITELFTHVTKEQWKAWFRRAPRNGLKNARCNDNKPFLYNPAGVANWLHRKGIYKQEKLVRLLANNLPKRSQDHKEEFVSSFGLLDSNS